MHIYLNLSNNDRIFESAGLNLNFPHLQDVGILTPFYKSKTGDVRWNYKKPRLLIRDWVTNCCRGGVSSPHLDESRPRVRCTKGWLYDAYVSIVIRLWVSNTNNEKYGVKKYSTRWIVGLLIKIGWFGRGLNLRRSALHRAEGYAYQLSHHRSLLPTLPPSQPVLLLVHLYFYNMPNLHPFPPANDTV